jgi:hypothetical protein
MNVMTNAASIFPTCCRSVGCGTANPTRFPHATYALHRSRSHLAVIRVYDAAGNVVETHEHKGGFREW